jgi:hypothetical protein
VGDDALIQSVIDDLPRFGTFRVITDRLIQHPAQTLPAPDVTPEDGLKSEWVK